MCKKRTHISSIIHYQVLVSIEKNFKHDIFIFLNFWTHKWFSNLMFSNQSRDCMIDIISSKAVFTNDLLAKTCVRGSLKWFMEAFPLSFVTREIGCLSKSKLQWGSFPQWRFERQIWVHKLFLNICWISGAELKLLTVSFLLYDAALNKSDHTTLNILCTHESLAYLSCVLHRNFLYPFDSTQIAH